MGCKGPGRQLGKLDRGPLTVAEEFPTTSSVPTLITTAKEKGPVFVSDADLNSGGSGCGKDDDDMIRGSYRTPRQVPRAAVVCCCTHDASSLADAFPNVRNTIAHTHTQQLHV